MANQFLNAQEYANVMLLLLKNQLVFGKLVDGQFKDQVTDENGLKISVKRPPRFVDQKNGTSAALALQDILVGSSYVNVNQYSKVHISVGDIEYVSSYNALMQNETMKSAASTLAHSIDMFIAQQTTKFHSIVAGGAPGVGSKNSVSGIGAISAPAHLQGAHTRLMDQGVPNIDMNGVVSFLDQEQVSGTLPSQYLPDSINRPALERQRIPMVGMVDWYGTQNIPAITTGTRAQGDGASSGGQINANSQNVNYRDVKDTMTQTLNLKSLAAGATVKAGEVFTIAGVYAYDWRAQQALPFLQQFRVVSDATETAGTTALTISPPIIVPGTNDGSATDPLAANKAFATVSAAPVLNAYVQFVGAASTILRTRSAFHKRAISLVSARLHMPFTGTASMATDPQTGIAIRYWRGSDITTGAHIHRWDAIYGAEVMDGFLGTRVVGPDA